MRGDRLRNLEESLVLIAQGIRILPRKYLPVHSIKHISRPETLSRHILSNDRARSLQALSQAHVWRICLLSPVGQHTLGRNRSYLDRGTVLQDGKILGNFRSLVQTFRLKQKEAANCFFRFGKRAVGYQAPSFM